mgnify:CR=1 FL=1
MKILLVAINAKYIHSNLAVYCLKSYAAKREIEVELTEYTINHRRDDILMDIYQRKNYISDPNDVTRPVGMVQRTTVSNIEIWCECFGKPKEDFKPSDSYAISAIMARLTSWEKTDMRKRLTIYGQQRVYIKKS